MLMIENIRKNILKELERQDMTQTALAKDAGVSQSTLNSFLNERRSNIYLENLISVANTLNMTATALFDCNYNGNNKIQFLEKSLNNLPKSQQEKLIKAMIDMVTATAQFNKK